ncbi:MAG: hypothetical protein AB8V19_02210 [Candidatus Midichloria sp.]
MINTNAERSKVPIKFDSLNSELIAESDAPWITLNFPRYVVQQIEPDPRLHSVIDCKHTGFSQNCYFMEFEKMEQKLLN